MVSKNDRKIDLERQPEPGAKLIHVNAHERGGKPVSAYDYWRGADGKRINVTNAEASAPAGNAATPVLNKKKSASEASSETDMLNEDEFYSRFNTKPAPDGDTIWSERPDLPRDDRHLWTVIDTDGVLSVENGDHWVNRIGYMVTEEEWDGDISAIFDSVEDHADDENASNDDSNDDADEASWIKQVNAPMGESDYTAHNGSIDAMVDAMTRNAAADPDAGEYSPAVREVLGEVLNGATLERGETDDLTMRTISDSIVYDDRTPGGSLGDYLATATTNALYGWKVTLRDDYDYTPLFTNIRNTGLNPNRTLSHYNGKQFLRPKAESVGDNGVNFDGGNC